MKKILLILVIISISTASWALDNLPVSLEQEDAPVSPCLNQRRTICDEENLLCQELQRLYIQTSEPCKEGVTVEQCARDQETVCKQIESVENSLREEEIQNLEE